MTRLMRALDVQRGEGALVALLLLHSFAMGLACVLFETAASGLFLARFSADSLPFAYIGAAVVVPLTGLAYGRLQRRVSPGRLWACALAGLLLAMLGLVGLVSTTTAAWPALLLMALTYVMSAVTALEFWGLAGRVLDLRQAKRLYGLIGAGEVAAGILGGFTVVLLLRVGSLVLVLLVAAAALGVCLVILLRLLATQRLQQGEDGDDDDDEPASGVLGLARVVLADRYLLLICGLYLFYNFSHDTLDYLHLTQVQVRYGDSGEAAATFIGVVQSVRHLVVLLARTFLSGRLLGRFGLGWALAATPVVVLGAGAAFVGLGLLGPGAGALFWPVIALKVGERIIYNSLGKPALLVAYRPLSSQRRDRAQLLIETVIEPMSTGLTGALLLGLTVLMHGLSPEGKTLGFALFMTATASGWLVMARLLRRGYAGVVTTALQRGTLESVLVRLEEEEVADLGDWLRTSRAEEVLYLLGVLELSLDRARLEVFVAGLLDHPDARVRTAAVEQIERGRHERFLPEVGERLGRAGDREEPPLVRAALLRSLAALGDVDVVDRIRPHLDDAEPAVRRSALVALLKYGGIPGVLRAGERLLELLRADAPVDRALAAHVLGEVAVPGFYHPLQRLLADPDPVVSGAALDAAGDLRHPRLWPIVVSSLARPTLWAPAVRALVRGGGAAVPSLLGHLAAQPARASRARALRVLARIGTPDAQEALRAQARDAGEGWLRREALVALAASGFRATPALAAEVDRELRVEATRAASLAAAVADLHPWPGETDDAPVAVLRRTLEQELARARDGAFALLSLVYHPDSIRHARVQLRGGNPERRTFALEVLENLCARRHREVIVPIAEGVAPAALGPRLLGAAAPPLVGRDARLVSVARGEPPWSTRWTRAFALAALAAPDAGGAAAPAVIEAALSDADAAVREAAAHTRLRRAQALRPDGSGDAMLKTIEKVLLLKSVEFFSTVEDDLLAELATTLSEVRFAAGETIFERGKVDSSMFVVGSGEVSVHDDAGAEVARLAARAVFGELAALDPQPRSATVRAVTDTALLRIDHATIVDLMAEHIEVAHGIIRFLIRRYGRPSSSGGTAKLMAVKPPVPA